MQRWPDKDPADIADYSIDWAALIVAPDTLASCTWSVSPAGPTLTPGAVVGTVAPLRISGGTAGETYVVTAQATLGGGQKFEQSMCLVVRDQ